MQSFFKKYFSLKNILKYFIFNNNMSKLSKKHYKNINLIFFLSESHFQSASKFNSKKKQTP
jgi:hypothetical protein